MRAAASGTNSALAKLLVEKAASSSTGIVAASRGKLRRLFCFEHGWLVHAASNVLEEQFGEFLVRKGIVSPSQRVAALEEASRQHKKLPEVLDPELARRGMEELIHDLLSSTLEWTDGESHFTNGQPKLEGEVKVRVPVVASILRHAKSHPASLDALRVRIGPPDTRVERTGPSRSGNPLWQFDETIHSILDASDGRRTLSDLVAASPAPEEPTLRAIHGLLLVGLLHRVETRAAGAGQPEAELSREECLTILARAERADHYAVLGIAREANAKVIRDAYYAIALRLHPDRFRSGPLQDLLPRIEAYFTWVTEAYNTLLNPALRAEYERQLDQVSETAGPKASETSYLARQNFLKGKTLYDRRRYTEALGFLENAVRLDGSQAEYHLRYGLMLTRHARRRDEAERELLRAVELDPSLAEAHFALAQLSTRGGRNAEAIERLKEAVRWNPAHGEALELLARLEAAAAAPDVGGTRRGFFGS